MIDRLKSLHDLTTEKLGRAPYLGPYLHANRTGWNASVSLTYLDDELKVNNCKTAEEALDQLQTLIENYHSSTPEEQVRAFAEKLGVKL